MSIEQAIAENTAAVKENSSLLLKLIAAYGAAPATADKVTKEIGDVARPAKTEPVEDKAPPVAETVDDDNEFASDSADTPLKPWAPHTQPTFLELQGKAANKENIMKAGQAIFAHVGKDVLAAVLGKFGADALSPRPGKTPLDETKYVGCFGDMLRTLGGKYDPRDAA